MIDATWLGQCPCREVIYRRYDWPMRRMIWQHGPNPEAVLIQTDDEVVATRDDPLDVVREWVARIHPDTVEWARVG